MMYRRMNPEQLEKLIEEQRKLLEDKTTLEIPKIDEKSVFLISDGKIPEGTVVDRP